MNFYHNTNSIAYTSRYNRLVPAIPTSVISQIPSCLRQNSREIWQFYNSFIYRQGYRKSDFVHQGFLRHFARICRRIIYRCTPGLTGLDTQSICDLLRVLLCDVSSNSHYGWFCRNSFNHYPCISLVNRSDRFLPPMSTDRQTPLFLIFVDNGPSCRGES